MERSLAIRRIFVIFLRGFSHKYTECTEHDIVMTNINWNKSTKEQAVHWAAKKNIEMRSELKDEYIFLCVGCIICIYKTLKHWTTGPTKCVRKLYCVMMKWKCTVSSLGNIRFAWIQVKSKQNQIHTDISNNINNISSGKKQNKN